MASTSGDAGPSSSDAAASAGSAEPTSSPPDPPSPSSSPSSGLSSASWSQDGAAPTSAGTLTSAPGTAPAATTATTASFSSISLAPTPTHYVTGSPPALPLMSASVTVNNNVVFFFGGQFLYYDTANSTTSNSTATTTTSTPTPTRSTSATPSVCDNLVVSYYIDLDRWQFREDLAMPTGLCGHTASLAGNTIFIVGGVSSIPSGASQDQVAFNSVIWRLDLEKGTWQSDTPQQTTLVQRYNHVAQFVGSGFMFVYGGQNSQFSILNDRIALEFDPTSHSLRSVTSSKLNNRNGTDITSLLVPRSQARSVMLRSGSSQVMFIYGGIRSSSTSTSLALSRVAVEDLFVGINGTDYNLADVTFQPYSPPANETWDSVSLTASSDPATATTTSLPKSSEALQLEYGPGWNESLQPARFGFVAGTGVAYYFGGSFDGSANSQLWKLDASTVGAWNWTNVTPKWSGEDLEYPEVLMDWHGANADSNGTLLIFLPYTSSAKIGGLLRFFPRNSSWQMVPALPTLYSRLNYTNPPVSQSVNTSLPTWAMGTIPAVILAAIIAAVAVMLITIRRRRKGGPRADSVDSFDSFELEMRDMPPSQPAPKPDPAMEVILAMPSSSSSSARPTSSASTSSSSSSHGTLRPSSSGSPTPHSSGSRSRSSPVPPHGASSSSTSASPKRFATLPSVNNSATARDAYPAVPITSPPPVRTTADSPPPAGAGFRAPVRTITHRVESPGQDLPSYAEALTVDESVHEAVESDENQHFARAGGPREQAIVIAPHVPAGKDEMELRVGDRIGLMPDPSESVSNSFVRCFNFNSGRTGLVPRSCLRILTPDPAAAATGGGDPTVAAPANIAWWRAQAAHFHAPVGGVARIAGEKDGDAGSGDGAVGLNAEIGAIVVGVAPGADRVRPEQQVPATPVDGGNVLGGAVPFGAGITPAATTALPAVPSQSSLGRTQSAPAVTGAPPPSQLPAPPRTRTAAAPSSQPHPRPTATAGDAALAAEAGTVAEGAAAVDYGVGGGVAVDPIGSRRGSPERFMVSSQTPPGTPQLDPADGAAAGGALAAPVALGSLSRRSSAAGFPVGRRGSTAGNG
ncbi:hypothetical protein DFJ73DRAFT_795620 [Zopfochytrium polystomum]|nr:hypothetical protein DFJ73DRAFT_795620 [Zopfochytrium polystomum]